MPRKVRQKYFLVQVTARGSKNILSQNKYRNEDWKTSRKDRDHGKVRSGDILLVYFAGDALAFRKHLGLLFNVAKTRDGNREFLLEKVRGFHPISLSELRSKVKEEVLSKSFLNCGRQGFNICQISQYDYEKALQISEERHESEMENYLKVARSILATAKEALNSHEIVRRAVRDGSLDKKDNDASNKLQGLLAQNVQSVENPKKNALFFSVGRGKYALTKWLKAREGEFTIRSLSYWIIDSAGKPTHYEDVTKAIQKVQELKTDKPSGLVYSTLNSSREFIGKGKGLFGLKKWEKVRKKVRSHMVRGTSFGFGTPDEFASLLNQVQNRFRRASSMIRISAPYIDVNTFRMFLGKAAKTARIKLLLTADKQLDDKIRKGLTSDFVEHFSKEYQIEIKRIDDLHSRFAVFNDHSCIICSSDFQREQYSNKFQCAVFSRDPRMVTKAARYFDVMWEASKTLDLVSEIRKTLGQTVAGA